jgi:hypothetical protein
VIRLVRWDYGREDIALRIIGRDNEKEVNENNNDNGANENNDYDDYDDDDDDEQMLNTKTTTMEVPTVTK